MQKSAGKVWMERRWWPKPTTRVGRIGLWLSTALVVCAMLRLILGSGVAGGFFLGWAIFFFCLDSPFLLVLSLRFLNRRVLWKVRNRLILTYLLMGLAPLVLFGTLTAVAAYIVAGQYAINSALSTMDEAADQLKGETNDAAGILTSPSTHLSDHDPIQFEENSNPREAETSLATLKDGKWQNLTLATKRGSTPPSPFAGVAKPAWLAPGAHTMVVFGGKLYLCREARVQEENRTVEVLGALEINHAALNSMSTSLGRMLVFSGFGIHTGEIDNAEKEAKTAEKEADRAEAAQDARQQIQEHARDAQQELGETQKDAQEQIRDAQRELGRAERDATRVRQATGSSAEERNAADSSVQEAQKELQKTQDEVQAEVQTALGRAQQAAPAPPLPATPSAPAPKPPSDSVRRTAPQHKVRPPATVAPAPAAASPSTGNRSQDGDFTAVSGGVLPPPAHFLDPRVYFTAPLPTLAWDSGKDQSDMLVVISRPSLLYTRLFATSVDMGSFLRYVLVAIAIFFGLLEILALWMATRLSGTITRSVAGLYRGTTEIDKGNLAYRVRLERQDQLGSLANSFNSMAGSIQDLLVQQREKERLLSELAIAQEVQRNLFPHSPASVTGLDLHAVCVPARSVSGDYFDFIFGGSAASRYGNTTCIALGDISGKGISAALLMASLHSAVRAFSLGEEQVPSPARLLELLNRHLYRSTTPEKYATLFLAFYDAKTCKLTYANGGHLPPLVLSADGSVRRLEAGGSVVGLLDGLTYGEDSVTLQPGDLMVAFSDGLTEPENETGEFGEERLLALLEAHRTAPLPAITEATFRTLHQWIGDHEQPDDMTLLLARRV